MPDLTTQLFYRVSVCRSFQLSGLDAIVQRFPTEPQAPTVQLPWLIGDLLSNGYIYTKRSVHGYIVNVQQAKGIQAHVQSPTLCALHDAWHDHYRENFDRHYKVNDFAALLYHEISHIKFCTSGTENLLESLCTKTQNYLWNYCQDIVKRTSNQTQEAWTLPFPDLPRALQLLLSMFEDESVRHHQEDARQFADYIPLLSRRIQELKKFEHLLSPSDYRVFIAFLDSLNPLNRR